MQKVEPKTSLEEFTKLLSTLKTKYPGFNPTAQQWGTTVRSYHNSLLDFPPKCLARAFRDAELESPKFFPSSGTLRKLSSHARSAFRREAETRKHSADVVRDYKQLRERPREPRAIQGRTPLPVTEKAQQEYIAGGKDRFDRLGRYWELESRKLRLDPEKPTPDSIGKRRWEQFWDVWASGETQAEPEDTAEIEI